MYFTDEQLKELRAEYGRVKPKFLALQEAYIVHDFKNPRAREHATQGFGRRLKTMVRCMQNIFENVPPDRTELPTRDKLDDAAINIQSFVLNVFGSLDNLAWIWVSEKGQKRPDGTPIANKQVGLGPKYEGVRRTFSPEFREYLDGMTEWFKKLGDLRDALVHRIPLYIPPYVVLAKDLPAYREFETKMSDAAKRRDIAEYDRLLWSN